MWCSSGKVRHETRSAADKAIKSLRRRNGAEVSAYQCDDCHGWHITHKRRNWQGKRRYFMT